MWGIKGLTYFVKGRLYLAVTNQCNTANSITVRGPGFAWGKEFIKLHMFEPSPEMLSTAVVDAFKSGKLQSESEEEITFAGFGEPLLRYDTVCEAAELIKDHQKSVSLRIKTNGLILPARRTDIVSLLKRSGIDKMAIALQTDNAAQYAEIMKPQEGGFDDVCAFISACAEEGLSVDCTAVERPGLDLESTRKLAHSLGASSFTTSTWFP
jgi:TatD family-associated radical SAM protein